LGIPLSPSCRSSCFGTALVPEALLRRREWIGSISEYLDLPASDLRRLDRNLRRPYRQDMSTVAEIESAIEQLPPEDFRALQEWMARRAEERSGRMWSPEELTAAAGQMVAEPDPVRAQALWEEIAKGFYGPASA